MTVNVPYYAKALSVNDRAVAIVTSIRDTAVYCRLPAYADYEVMLPTSEINVRRGKRVKDYISLDQQIVVTVLRDDGARMDVSMKNITSEDAAKTLDMYQRDLKVARLVLRTAMYDGTYTNPPSRDKVAKMYTNTVYPTQTKIEDDDDFRSRYPDVLAVFEAIRAGANPYAGTDVMIPAALVSMIHAKLPAPVFCEECEITVRFGTAHDGAERVSSELTRLSELPGIEVFVVSPPKYRLTATASTKQEAIALLEAAKAVIPAPC